MIRRGEIYWIQLDPTIGAEIKKTRPALIVSNDTSNQFSDLVTLLPLTSQVKAIRPFEVLITNGQGGLLKTSKIKCNQIRTVDKKRLIGKSFGPRVGSEVMNQVSAALKIHLELE
ncbi:MAG TPA: type II toxin-antitoxin system PemK/MazF family toxin [Candidatus Saccharimonadales bacterium]|nr:type II toxin-antitoxin system PemK/MazF family toxin [Candidatus Saccharimonadales bacterium]